MNPFIRQVSYPAGEPIFVIPPLERIPLMMMLADQLAESRDWGHGPLQLEEVHATHQGKDTKVAVLDTGCDFNHPDLRANILDAKDFTGEVSGPADVQGHGTHCAGVVAAATNGQGLIGSAPQSKLLIGKVLDDDGSGASTWIANGIRWAVAQKANIISMSLGSSSPSSIIHAAVKEAVAAGVWVVAAASNSGPGANTVGYPGAFPECICVGAVDSALAVAVFSSRGPQLDIAAPGVKINSTYPGGRYAVLSGTSMATPYVAGVLAVYHESLRRLGRPIPTTLQLLEELKRTAKDLGVAGQDSSYGHGLIQPLKMLPVGTTPPPSPTDPVVLTHPELLLHGIENIVVNFKK